MTPFRGGAGAPGTPSRLVKPDPSRPVRRSPSRLARALGGVASFLLPAACAGCSGSLAPGEADPVLCPACRSRLSWLPWPRCPRCSLPRGSGRSLDETCLDCAPWPACLEAAHTPLALTNPASQVVHALKYGGRRGAAHFMAEMMIRGARGGWIPPPDAILVPIPTTARREHARGYNQARELARELGTILQLPCLDLLERVGSQESQIALHPDERRANVSGVFQLDSGAALPQVSTPLVLVDDVLTTGATAGAAAEALETIGVGSVQLWAFARTLPEHHTQGA